jgi:hypothetical protein
LASCLGCLAGVSPVAAETIALQWTQFFDPAEKAMALDVPTGWSVRGGVTRLAPYLAQPWVSAISPDGTIEIFIGDPSIPGFRLPAANQAEGAVVPALSPVLPPVVAFGYRPGGKFARVYGLNALGAAAGCADANVVDMQPLPDLAREQWNRAAEFVRGIAVNGAAQPPAQDAGLATFNCHQGSSKLAAGVIADTSQPVAGGSWGVGLVAGYLTVPGQEAWARAILMHMLASRESNPSWVQAMREAGQEALRQQTAIDRDVLQTSERMSWAFTDMLVAKGEAEQGARTAAHNAQMAELNRESTIRNQNFQTHMAIKGLNAWNVEAHIRDHALYHDVATGQIFEGPAAR